MNYRVGLGYRIPEDREEQKKVILQRLNERWAFSPETAIFLKIFDEEVIEILRNEGLIAKIETKERVSERKIKLATVVLNMADLSNDDEQGDEDYSWRDDDEQGDEDYLGVDDEIIGQDIIIEAIVDEDGDFYVEQDKYYLTNAGIKLVVLMKSEVENILSTNKKEE